MRDKMGISAYIFEKSSILASVSFWPDLIIELVARVVPARLIISLNGAANA